MIFLKSCLPLSLDTSERLHVTKIADGDLLTFANVFECQVVTNIFTDHLFINSIWGTGVGNEGDIKMQHQQSVTTIPLLFVRLRIVQKKT